MVSANGAGAFHRFIRMYMPALAGRVTVLPYWRFAIRWRLRPGTYIFSQTETLSRGLANVLRRICDDLRGRAGFRVLNQPGRSLGRYDLLHTLHREGLNSFQVFRLDPHTTPVRLPVFIRRERDNCGSQTRLLRTPEEYQAAVRAIGPDDGREEKCLIVEFCNTADPHGTYRKYSVVIVGDCLVPRHLLFGNTWMTKWVGESLTAEQILEERQFVDQNPHAEQLRKIFALANIQYGRIDYALLDGKVQTWEINTNPTLAGEADYTQHPVRGYVQDRFGERIRAAFEANDLCEAGRPYVVGLANGLAVAWNVLLSAVWRKLRHHERRAMRNRLKAGGFTLEAETDRILTPTKQVAARISGTPGLAAATAPPSAPGP
jgi:hypothetical protein